MVRRVSARARGAVSGVKKAGKGRDEPARKPRIKILSVFESERASSQRNLAKSEERKEETRGS